jgi:hypothetical protein
MPPVGLEPTISAGERPKTYALDRKATGSGISVFVSASIFCYNVYVLALYVAKVCDYTD